MTGKNSKNSGAMTALLASCAILVAAGCTPTHNVRGNIVQQHQLAEVQTGVDTKLDVLKKLGSPTTKAPFDDNVWYYMGQETEKRGILDPKVIDEKIVVAVFNNEGVLEKLEDIDTNRNDLPLVRKKTPTSGNEITAMQQLLGNLGRFNTSEQ